MDLDRTRIERKDFTVVRRGYEQTEVDLHLRELADSVAELRAELRSTPAGVAGAAAEHVKTIVEAAEKSAADIQEKAENEASRLLEESSRVARDTRERADHDSAEQLRHVQEAANGLLERADTLEKQLDAVAEGIQGAATSLVESLRGGSAEIEQELAELRQELLAARPLRPGSRRADVEAQVEAEPEIEVESPAEPAPPAGAPTGRFAPAANGGSESEPAQESEVAEPAAEPQAQPPVEPEPEREHPPEPAAGGAEGARLIALNMALNGAPRDEAARYLADNFDLEDPDAILDDVYSRVGG
ncbi:MAG: DivIVA domain-containing protein [Thermoleophilaceae bacterium]